MKKTYLSGIAAIAFLIGSLGLFTGCPDPSNDPPPPAQYDITVNQPATGGSIAADKTAAVEGETVTITAAPATGFHLGNVSVTRAGGSAVTTSGANNSRTFVMPGEPVTVTATFVADSAPTFAITVTQPATGGTISADRAMAAQGEEVTITATPNSGFVLESVTVTGVSTVTGEGNVRKFIMPGQAVTVTAVFEPETSPVPSMEVLVIDNFDATRDGYWAEINTLDLDTSIATADESSSSMRMDYSGAGGWGGGFGMAEPVNLNNWDRLTFWVRANRTGDEYRFGMQHATGDHSHVFTVPTANEWHKISVAPTEFIHTNNNTLPDLIATGWTLIVVTHPAATGGQVWIDQIQLERDVPGYGEITYVYSVNVTQLVGGTVSADKAVANAGDTITLTAVPGEGYTFGSFAVTPSVSLIGDGPTQTFAMPAANVIATAIFELIPPDTFPTSPSIDAFDYYTATVESANIGLHGFTQTGGVWWNGLVINAKGTGRNAFQIGGGGGFNVTRTSATIPFFNDITTLVAGHPYVSLALFTEDVGTIAARDFVFELRTGTSGDVAWTAPLFSTTNPNAPVGTAVNASNSDSGWMEVRIPLASFRDEADSPITSLSQIVISGWSLSAPVGNFHVWIGGIELVPAN